MRAAGAADGVGRRELIDALQRRIRATLDARIERGRRFALVEYPTHHNVGDQAIWLGESRYLGTRGCRALYLVDRFHFSSAALRRRLRPGDLILLTGGGNLGDVHPKPQELRELVLADFPDHPVLQLPQTVHFRTEDGRRRARAAFDGHPDFTLLVRDRVSQRVAEEDLGVPSILCPDMAFMLGPLERPAPPTRDVLWLARTDKESRAALGGGQPTVDWTPLQPRVAQMAAYAAARNASRGLGRVLARPAAVPAPVARLSCHAFDPVAGRHLRAGLALLGSGRVVVTDRLHAHILSVLLGIPHVVLDNNYGKLSAFLEAWTGISDLVRVASNRDEAELAARELLPQAAAE